jgi:hypothetical protein
LRIAVGLILLVFGLGFLTSLNNVSPEFIWLQVFLGVFLILTGYGVLRKKLLSTYKSFTVFLFSVFVFLSLLMFPIFKVLEDITTQEKFVEFSKAYWRVKVSEYFSTTPQDLTQYGRTACYGFEIISGLPVPCDLITTENFDKISEYLASKYYETNPNIKKLHSEIQMFVYPNLGFGLLFSFFIFLLNKNNIRNSFKTIGVVLVVLGVLYLFFVPYYMLYGIKDLPQLKNLSGQDSEVVQNLIKQEFGLVSNYGVIYLFVGIVFTLVGVFLPKSFLTKQKQ